MIRSTVHLSPHSLDGKPSARHFTLMSICGVLIFIIPSCLTGLSVAADTSGAGGTGASSAQQQTPPPTWNCHDFNYCDDTAGFEAILALHQQLDDDQSGYVDISETKGFLREELQYKNGGVERHSAFHRDNDTHISVDELWYSWLVSDVHNWTTEQTVAWLKDSVNLPQFEDKFVQKQVTGKSLPRLATSQSYLTELGIKSSIHRQKISLKAMDAVLFGPPKSNHFVKDVVLAIAVVVACLGTGLAYRQHKHSQEHAKKMLKDMEILSKAEEDLMKIQSELERVKQEQELVTNEKEQLKRQLETESFSHRNYSSSNLTDSARMLQLEQDLRVTQDELERVRRAAIANGTILSPELAQWLRQTYEIELKNYETKKSLAEQQLFAAKDGCEKLRKKRSTFMGSLRVAHGSSIDDVDSTILQAKASLSEVTRDLQERLHRWRNIESLVGIPIMYNANLAKSIGRGFDESQPTTVVPSVCSSHSDDESRDEFISRPLLPSAVIPNGPIERTVPLADVTRTNFTVGGNDEHDPQRVGDSAVGDESSQLTQHSIASSNNRTPMSNIANAASPPNGNSARIVHSESCYELESSPAYQLTPASSHHLATSSMLGSSPNLKKKRSFMSGMFHRKKKLSNT